MHLSSSLLIFELSIKHDITMMSATVQTMDSITNKISIDFVELSASLYHAIKYL